MKTQSPPRLATKLLLTFLRDELANEVIGDLEENFKKVCREKSLFRAKINYWFQVLNYFRPFAMRNSRLKIHSTGMFENYFVVTRRTLMKQKLYSFINIAGLSIGLASFLIIVLYTQHEFSYNRFYPDVEKIYRVYQKQEGNNFMGSDYFSVTPARLAFVMQDELPEVEHATSCEQTNGLISFGDEHYYENGIAGDSGFFYVLPIKFVKGDPFTALSNPRAIVLTESLARKVFKDEDPVGKIVKYQERDGFVVTAVIEDASESSSLEYSFIVNILYNDYWREEIKQSRWSGNSFYTFFTLDEGADPIALQGKFPSLIKKYRDMEGAYQGYPFVDTFLVQPITEMYFQQGINFDLGLKGNIKMVYSFLVAAVLVLLLACVNYMNLAIARSIKRSREVGIRKVAGAVRKQIISQFLTESILIAIFSMIIAVAGTYLLLPLFGSIVDRPVEFLVLENLYLLPGMFALVLMVGLVSGSYPAFVMSNLNPIEVLKIKTIKVVSGLNLQRTLVVVQFTISISLVVVSLFIQQQLTFMHHKDVGYEKSNVLTLRVQDRSLTQKFSQLNSEWARDPRVISSTLCSHLPTNITSSNIFTTSQGIHTKDGLAIYNWRVEHHFMDVFGLKLVAGRKFSTEFVRDPEQSCMINETAAAAFGWSVSEAIGKEVFSGDLKLSIIGVVKDFHMHPMHLPLMPLMMRVSDVGGNFICVKVHPEKIEQTIRFLEKSVGKVSTYPFNYEFLEDSYSNLYRAENKLGQIIGFFTIVTIIIASLGLFGLAAFACEQRTKEIGIRKVLGASVNNIVVLLSKDLLLLVFVAIVIATPISWYVTSMWLEGFAYKILIEWQTFLVAGTFALIAAKISIGYQSIKASIVNPVNSLRAE
jgi:putative ABC transport system permease protein